MGSGTTLLAALRLRRCALGAEFSIDFVELSLRRLCSELVQVTITVSSFQFSLDLFSDPVDRSDRASTGALGMSPHAKLVHQERRFHFIGRTKREVIFSVLAATLEEAWQEFRASGRCDSDALFIIKTETEIYLA
ncbi:MAG: hypothetical protein ACRD2R_00890 [Terriglobales bacterium]